MPVCTHAYIGIFCPVVLFVPGCGEDFDDYCRAHYFALFRIISTLFPLLRCDMIILREAYKIIPAVKMNERRGIFACRACPEARGEVPVTSVTSVTSDFYY
jgi:hypothetical protein